MKAVCPVCGHVSVTPIPLEISFVAATGEIRHKDRKCTVQAVQLDIFEQLYDAYPQRVPFDALHRAIYRQRPDNSSRKTLRQHIWLLRRALERAGLGVTVLTSNERGYNEPHAYALHMLARVQPAPTVTE